MERAKHVPTITTTGNRFRPSDRPRAQCHYLVSPYPNSHLRQKGYEGDEVITQGLASRLSPPQPGFREKSRFLFPILLRDPHTLKCHCIHYVRYPSPEHDESQYGGQHLGIWSRGVTSPDRSPTARESNADLQPTRKEQGLKQHGCMGYCPSSPSPSCSCSGLTKIASTRMDVVRDNVNAGVVFEGWWSALVDFWTSGGGRRPHYSTFIHILQAALALYSHRRWPHQRSLHLHQTDRRIAPPVNSERERAQPPDTKPCFPIDILCPAIGAQSSSFKLRDESGAEELAVYEAQAVPVSMRGLIDYILASELTVEAAETQQRLNPLTWEAGSLCRVPAYGTDQFDQLEISMDPAEYGVMHGNAGSALRAQTVDFVLRSREFASNDNDKATQQGHHQCHQDTFPGVPARSGEWQVLWDTVFSSGVISDAGDLIPSRGDLLSPVSLSAFSPFRTSPF
ncbi:hypothetical protein QBC44DRAFT_303708 [Cladorrhinum sp. PSN332]|nr:hypothetical protein QBC44DRAFT_303708 [Cladorrhinum sp. PSN332]